MARSEISRVRGGVLFSALLSAALAGCSSSSGTPNVADSGIDAKAQLVHDGGDANTDLALDRTTTETRAETATDTREAGVDAGAGGTTGTGGVTGMGGTPGTGGASSGGMTGSGGADAGIDAPSDSPATDVPAEAGTGGASGSDGGSDASSDTTPACGAGCPTTIQGTHLALWLAADFGVSCDSGRVTGWQDRGTMNLPIAQVSTKTGPRCGVDTIAGRPALFFDTPGTDDLDGVLTVNLNAILTNTNYTVLVVERRQTDAEGYILGTTGISTSCDEIADGAYRFGYDPQYTPMKFVAGPYSADPDVGGCIDPISSYTAYSPAAPAVIDVEVFDQTVGHTLAIDGTIVDHNTEMTPISGLSTAYIGRAFNVLNLGARHSRYLGDVAEIVIYNVALSDTDRTAVEGYLKQRWNP